MRLFGQLESLHLLGVATLVGRDGRFGRSGRVALQHETRIPESRDFKCLTRARGFPDPRTRFLLIVAYRGSHRIWPAAALRPPHTRRRWLSIPHPLLP